MSDTNGNNFNGVNDNNNRNDNFANSNSGSQNYTTPNNSGSSGQGSGYYSSNNYYNANGGAYNNQYNGSQNNFGEYSYRPDDKKRNRRKKVIAAVSAILCTAAIGVVTIVGVSLISGKNIIGSVDNSSSISSKENTTNNAKSTVDRKNLPTLEQLATPSDAMKIPDIVKKMSPSVVGISCMLDQGTATGTGIIMSEDGYIITNAHVVDGAKTISVVLPSSYSKSDDKKSDSSSSDSKEEALTYTAELVGKDTQTDIAVLKINKKGLTKADFGNSADLQVGEVSIVIGNPLGLDLANSVTAGIISATDRTLTIEDRTMNLIQTDASVNNGNSGGPLINAYGQVIGITSAKVSTSVGEGLGFAIPIDEAIPIIKDLMKNGYVTGRPSIGVSGVDVSTTMSSYYGVPQGFLVTAVTKGGAAEKAGIKAQDVIIGINDTVVTSINELNAVKNKCKVGDTITLTIYRNNKKSDYKVTLTEATNQDTTDDDSSKQQEENQQNYEEFYRQFYNNYGGGNGNNNGYNNYGY